MSTLKVRSWDGDTMHYDGDHTSCPYCGSGGGYNSDYKIMLFTGLKDKNNKEAYKEDIAKAWFECPLGFDDDPHEITGEITQDTWGTWCLDCGHVVMNLEAFIELEVIGNIYENPELLK